MASKVVLAKQLVDGTGRPPVQDAVVVIEGKKIAAAGSRQEIDIPKDAEIIDGSQYTVMPGLMDVHWHVGGDFRAQRVLRMALHRGITTIGTVSGGPAGCRLRDAIESGDVENCARLVVGCIVNATNGHVKGRTADGPWEIRKAVREMVQEGADFIKTAASGGFWSEHEHCAMTNYTQEELNALVDEAHAWGRPVAVHAHTQPGLGFSIEAGADMIHHGAFIDEAALQGIAAKKLYYVPTLRVTSDKNISAWPDRPWMMKEMKESQPIHRAGVRRAKELGITIALGTDGPGSSYGWVPGDATPWEMIELMQCGLSPMEVVVIATRNTAAAMGKLDSLGTIEPGKQADLLVVDCDVTKDIAPLYEQENILLVMKDGQVESTDERLKKYYQVRRPGKTLRPKGVMTKVGIA
ncbi:MAG TPA: amidohydrolase family protein [Firmicutes bacterium]|nr:amidohydrolase family protein [Bacillota bacterium]